MTSLFPGVGTENCTIDHNLFDAVGGNGVFLTDYNRHALITANGKSKFTKALSAVACDLWVFFDRLRVSIEMRHIGENGVAMRGSTEWVDGRGGNQPRFNTIDGNLIHHLGLCECPSNQAAVACDSYLEVGLEESF